MPEIVARVGVLLLLSLVLFLIVSAGRRFVERQRQRVLASAPTAAFSELKGQDANPGSSRVHILAFSSADCHQCHTLQTPALSRVLEARGAAVSVVEVDAPGAPEMVEHYRVLTVPTTVVLDATGRPHAVNYGFANTQRLLEQVDSVLAQVAL